MTIPKGCMRLELFYHEFVVACGFVRRTGKGKTVKIKQHDFRRCVVDAALRGVPAESGAARARKRNVQMASVREECAV